MGAHAGAGKAYASGGVALASSATTATFGESGVPELAMFLPLNASPSSILNNASGFGGGGGAGGSVLVRVELSPDLEGRIVNNTLQQAALSVEKVYRNR